MTLTALAGLVHLPPLVHDVVVVSSAVEVLAQLVLRWPKWKETWYRRQDRADQARQRRREHLRQIGDRHDPPLGP
jgi:hypothetical protein